MGICCVDQFQLYIYLFYVLLLRGRSPQEEERKKLTTNLITTQQ